MEAFSSFEKTHRIEASHNTTIGHLSEAEPRQEMLYAIARQHYRSLLDIAERVYETTVLDYRFPSTDPFLQALRRHIGRLNQRQIEQAYLDRFILVEYPKNLGPEHASMADAL